MYILGIDIIITKNLCLEGTSIVVNDYYNKVYNEKMPLTDITKKICKHINLDPLRLISSGSMLITCKNGDELVNVLQQKGINAVIIGNIIKEKGILVINGEELEVDSPKRDELFTIDEK